MRGMQLPSTRIAGFATTKSDFQTAVLIASSSLHVSVSLRVGLRHTPYTVAPFHWWSIYYGARWLHATLARVVFFRLVGRNKGGYRIDAKYAPMPCPILSMCASLIVFWDLGT